MNIVQLDRPRSHVWHNQTKAAMRILRRFRLAPSPEAYQRAAKAWRTLPIPARTTNFLNTVVLRKPWYVTVPVDRLLLGAPASGWTAQEFAEETDDLLWPSRRLIDGPHVDLLLRPSPTDEEILSSPYGQMARRCIDARGSFLGATDDTGIVSVAKAFTHGGHVPDTVRLDSALVAPIRASDYYQVIQGHHELARVVARGESFARVRIRWLPVTTPLQNLLVRMSWLEGSRELYQPIDAPELRRGWTTVRQCTDRFEKMQAFLAELGVRGSYLDVASCYGWFVAAMENAGFEAYGMEYDPLAVPLGRAVYHLKDGQVVTGDATELLGTGDRTWDVVTCFSLLHHFVIERRSVSPDQLLKLLDNATERVLFIDMGQEHEAWLRKEMSGWTPQFISEFLQQNTTFDRIVDLGPDEDARPPYAANYGRHLFACVRE
jgi:hypothetical protein